jgi:hypothetical protein
MGDQFPGKITNGAQCRETELRPVRRWPSRTDAHVLRCWRRTGGVVTRAECNVRNKLYVPETVSCSTIPSWSSAQQRPGIGTCLAADPHASLNETSWHPSTLANHCTQYSLHRFPPSFFWLHLLFRIFPTSQSTSQALSSIHNAFT